MHSYFSPYSSPYDAAVTYFAVLCDLHGRLSRKTHLADSPFRFATGIDQFTGEFAWTLMGLEAILGQIPSPPWNTITSRAIMSSGRRPAWATELWRRGWPGCRSSKGEG